MPRYFFDLYNDIEVRDDLGKELPDLASARENALVEAREMMTQAIEDGELNLNHRIEVRDAVGAVVHTLHFGDAVGIIPQHRADAPDVSAFDHRGD
jgi:hypothetical protein